MTPGKQTYPCFACQRAGHEVQVFLDGKDEQGRTKYLNQDGTRHVHYQLQQQQSEKEEEGSFEVVSSQELQQLELREQQLKQQSSPELQQLEQEQQEQTYIGKVTDESVRRGITSLKLFSDLSIQVEGIGIDCNQTRVTLEDILQKMDRLLKMVFAREQQ